VRIIKNTSLAAVSLLAIVVFMLSTRETPLLAVSLSEPIAPTTAGPCALVCWMGLGGSCPTDYHLAITTENAEFRNVEWGTGPHNDYLCYPQSCEERHGFNCEPIPAGLEELRASLISDDAERTSMLIRQSNERIVLNLARSAVQAVGCANDVVAHMPVTPVFARRLQDLLQ
jgi:hypothetical protein